MSDERGRSAGSGGTGAPDLHRVRSQCGLDPGPTTHGPLVERLAPGGQRLGKGSEKKQIPTSCATPALSRYALRPVFRPKTFESIEVTSELSRSAGSKLQK